MKRYGLHSISGLLLLLAVMSPAQAQPAGGVRDEQVLFKMWDTLRQQNAALEKANPQQAIDVYTKFLNENAHNNSVVAIFVVQTIAHLYAYNLKDTDKAVALLEAGMERFTDDPNLRLLGEEGHALIDGGREAAAIQLYQAHEAQIFEGYVSPAQEILNPYVRILLKAGQDDKALELTTRALINYPDLADPISNWEWPYQDVIDILIRQGHAAEALRWARWRFAVTNCQDAGLSSTGHTLATAWDAAEPSGQAQLAFVAALHDPTRPNPLQAIQLPAMNPKYVAELAARPAGSPKYPENIHLELITGRFNAAMLDALKLLGNRQSPASGVREVCRVFKAADLNFKRANEFLNFFKTGDGDDPLEAFFMEHPAAADPAPGATTPPPVTAAAPGKAQLPQALRLQLVAINNMTGDNPSAITPINEGLVTARMLLSQIRSGHLNLNHAWQAHDITADDLLAIFSLRRECLSQSRYT